MKRLEVVLGSIVVVGALVLGGCASPATAQGMTVTSADIEKTTPPSEMANSLRVEEVSGGSSTGAMDKSKIANGDFEKALVDSLGTAQLLSKNGAPRYRVKAALYGLDQPDAGIDMTVVSHVRYVVTEQQSGRTVLDEVIVSSFTAHLGDATLGPARMRVATEGAARKSIATFIQKVNGSQLRGAVATR